MAVLHGFVLLAVIIGIGWAGARVGWFGQAEQRMLALLTFRVGSPALLFTVIADSDRSVILSDFLGATVIGVVVAAAFYMLAARVLWRRRATHLIVGGMAVSYVNTVNLGVPIAAYVLGDATLSGPMVLFQLFVLQPLWLASLDVAGGAGTGWGRMVLRPLTNPLTLGSLAGLVVLLTGVQLPAMVRDPVDVVAGLAIPTMLIAFGISLRFAPRPGQGGTGGELVLVVLAKLVVMPLATALVGHYLLGLDHQALVAATVIAALPTAQNVFLLAVVYRRGEGLARDAVTLTTLLALPAILVTVGLLG